MCVFWNRNLANSCKFQKNYHLHEIENRSHSIDSRGISGKRRNAVIKHLEEKKNQNEMEWKKIKLKNIFNYV